MEGSTTEGSGIKFGVLGPLMLRCGNGDVDIAPGKQRTVLALLIARRNTVVSLDGLMEELWPESPPRSATSNIRTYVSALRRSLGQDRALLDTCGDSYILRVAEGQLDMSRFDRNATQAREALRRGVVAEAVRRYQDALRYWRGEPLQGVPTGPVLRSYVTALKETWISAREGLLEAEYRAGNNEVAGQLRNLLIAHPSRESAWVMLVRVLNDSGDRAGALATYQQARQSLAATLGLDPGPDLQAVHREILAGKPHFTGIPGLNRQDSRRVTTVPRQLSLSPAVLVGREAGLSWLRGALTQSYGEESRRKARPRMVALHGPGGVGKSALAVAAAHLVAADYPDGQIYVDLQGDSRGMLPLDPVDVLGRFLRALEVPEARVGYDVGEAAAWFRSSTAERRVLLLLDNAAGPEQVRPLLPAGPGCAVLVTSRRPMSALDGVTSLPVGQLSVASGVEMLRQLVGPAQVDQHPLAARTIVDLCGHLPLAVRIIGLCLACSRGWDLPEAAARLQHARSRLNELDLDDLEDAGTAFGDIEALYRRAGCETAAVRCAGWAVQEAQQIGASLELDDVRKLGAVLWLCGDRRADQVLRCADETDDPSALGQAQSQGARS